MQFFLSMLLLVRLLWWLYGQLSCGYPQCSSNCSSAAPAEKCDGECPPWRETLQVMAEVYYALWDWVCLYSKSKICFCECKLMQTYLMREKPAWLATHRIVINKYFIWKNFLAGKCDSLECWWTNSKFCGDFCHTFLNMFFKVFIFICVCVCSCLYIL